MGQLITGTVMRAGYGDEVEECRYINTFTFSNNKLIWKRDVIPIPEVVVITKLNFVNEMHLQASCNLSRDFQQPKLHTLMQCLKMLHRTAMTQELYLDGSAGRYPFLR